MYVGGDFIFFFTWRIYGKKDLNTVRKDEEDTQEMLYPTGDWEAVDGSSKGIIIN